MNDVPYDSVLETLTRHRDALQARYDQLAEAAEDARRACVPVQQQLEKIKDAIGSLGLASEWAAPPAVVN